jgi:NAD(P)-dependent dehydrogenase (short-subunit alcohol dehydrogenase family)
MMDGFPTFTKLWHNRTYSAIDPTRPELSATGKTIFVTGGGHGIGASIVMSFARAGARDIVISGRTTARLQETKAVVEKATSAHVHVFTADVTDEGAMAAIFKKVGSTIGRVDVLVANAGYLAEPKPFSSGNLTDWWHGFEVNVKGTAIAAQEFLTVAAENAVLLSLSTSIVHLGYIPGFSSYAASKTAAVRMLDFVQGENPGIRVINVQPGVVDTDMSRKTGMTGVPFDDGRCIKSSESRELTETCYQTDIILNSEPSCRLYGLGSQSRGRVSKGEVCVGQLVSIFTLFPACSKAFTFLTYVGTLMSSRRCRRISRASWSWDCWDGSELRRRCWHGPDVFSRLLRGEVRDDFAKIRLLELILQTMFSSLPIHFAPEHALVNPYAPSATLPVCSPSRARLPWAAQLTARA